MKTREEQLEAWKAKRTKPLAAIGNSNIVNRPPKPPAKRLTVLSTDSQEQQQLKASTVDKENQPDHLAEKATVVTRTSSSSRLPRFKQSVGSDKVAASKTDCTLRSEAQTSRKVVVPASTLENMENQYDLLKGTLDTLKRESMRYVSHEAKRAEIKEKWPCHCISSNVCRASISGDASKAGSAQVLGPHNPADNEVAARSSLSRTAASLLRDSSLLADPSKQRTTALASTSNELQPVFELGGRFETRSLAGLATELFKDPAFVELCDKGLNGTLQRTKDGATAESRIQELAGVATPQRHA